MCRVTVHTTTARTVCDGDLDVVIYTVILGDPEFCAIKGLDAGTYWIGMRPVGLLYDWSAVMVTLRSHWSTLSSEVG